jgi:hypothetical protein
MVAKSCTEVNDVKIPFYLRIHIQTNIEELNEMINEIIRTNVKIALPTLISAAVLGWPIKKYC